MSDDIVNIEVDGKPVEARRGQMVIEVTDEIGAYVPRFCYHEKLSIAANCRMCLIEFEKAPQADPGLCAARERGHEDLYEVAARHCCAKSDDGVPADQSSTGLPHLRSGRRV